MNSDDQPNACALGYDTHNHAVPRAEPSSCNSGPWGDAMPQNGMSSERNVVVHIVAATAATTTTAGRNAALLPATAQRAA